MEALPSANSLPQESLAEADAQQTPVWSPAEPSLSCDTDRHGHGPRPGGTRQSPAAPPLPSRPDSWC